jgi:adiponectin receptor
VDNNITSKEVEPFVRTSMISRRRDSTASDSPGAPVANATRRPKRLLLRDEVQVWQKDNEFIISGYRYVSTCLPRRRSHRLTSLDMLASGSLSTSVASLGYMHNQTINTYSHLVGALVFFTWPLQLYRDSHYTSSYVEREDFLVQAAYCYSVAACLTLSSLYVLLLRYSAKRYTNC